MSEALVRLNNAIDALREEYEQSVLDCRQRMLEIQQERDQLRAELAETRNNYAAAMQSYSATIGEIHAELAAAKEQQIATLTELQSFREHTTALTADNERLRRALQPFADRIKAYPPWMWTAMVEREKEGIITGGFMVGNEAVTHMPAMLLVQAEEALAATPAQSLAAHDAALLREVAERKTWSIDSGLTWLISKEKLLAEADRIERGQNAK